MPDVKSVAVILTAAGTSSRFGTGEKKEYLPLASNLFPETEGTVLSSSAEAFISYFSNNNTYQLQNLIITITPNSDESIAYNALTKSEYVKTALRTMNIQPIFIEGNNSRQGSVFCALEYLHSLNTFCDIVLIHDAARPFVSKEIIKKVTIQANEKGASVPSITPVDTQKEISAEGRIIRHLQRSNLAAVQTPQGFDFIKLYAAHKKASEDGNIYTDDTEIWGTYIGDVYTVEGSENNTKITFRQDMNTKNEKEYRTGIGYDLHKLVENKPLILGGVTIPFEKGEEAHSDGDVLLHAITDCLLGAAGLSDIGELFSPSDNTWKDANSAILLQTAWEKVKNDSWNIQNIDCVIQIEKPKFLPYRKEVIKSIARILNIESNRIFVKAKTGEGLGDIGQGNAVSVQAICLLYR